MFKPKFYMVITILALLVLVSGACAESSTQTMTATPLEVPNEGSPGEYINVIIQVSSDQPCKLVLCTLDKVEGCPELKIVNEETRPLCSPRIRRT